MSSAPSQQTEAPVVAAKPVGPIGLRERAVRQRMRQNKLAMALVAVLAVGALAVYVPQRRAIAATRLELARTEAELANNQGKAAMLPQLVDAVTKLRRRVDQYKPLRGKSDIERALHEISTINTSTQLAGYKYEFDLEKTRPMCREQPLKITFEADFVDAMSFIQKLEAMDRLTRLRELSIQKRDASSGASLTKGKGGEVEVTMSLSIFFDPSLEALK
jgi:Tfp pilus assembly protein PilO